MVSPRQANILNKIVKEYIEKAEPISSQLLAEKYDFGICSSTIRIEMQRLVDKGYLYQPHTSAGRIPTDKGYRFFVDCILEKRRGNTIKNLEIEDDIITITKFLAFSSSNLALGYLSEKKFFWKEGWKEILKEPEFEEVGLAIKLAQLVEDLEKNMIPTPDLQIYIGGENPFSEIKDFSIITAGNFSILGPKRMAYAKNINLINSIKR